METQKTRTCEKCSIQVPLDKTRLYPRDENKNWLICESCCEKLKQRDTSHKIINKPTTLPKKDPIKNVSNPQLAESKMIKQKIDPDYETKHCGRCSYYFKIDMNRHDLNRSIPKLNKIVCPYCGKDDRLGFNLGPK